MPPNSKSAPAAELPDQELETPALEGDQDQPEGNTPSVTSTDLLEVETHAASEATPDWLLAATAVKHGWVRGQQVTLEAFKAAVDAAANEEVR